MRSKTANIVGRSTLVVLLLTTFSYVIAATMHTQSQSAKQASVTSPDVQKSFATPQQAAVALIQAAANYDVAALLEIFGPDGKDFVSSADPVQDKKYAVAFAAKAREKNLVTIESRARAIVLVGNDGWPLPIPIIKKGRKWYFDSQKGRDEILLRRIGANELDAIQICRGFVEAQKEYASEVHDNSGVNQYAQRIISTPGKRDGLYWQNEDGTPGGADQRGYCPSHRGRLLTQQTVWIPWLLLQGFKAAGPCSAVRTT